MNRSYGQEVPPFELAPVSSPVAQTVNVPVANVEYEYDVPEPLQPAGGAGMASMNGPRTSPVAFVCRVTNTDGSGPGPEVALVIAVQLVVALAPPTGRPPQ